MTSATSTVNADENQSSTEPVLRQRRPAVTGFCV